MNQKVKEPFLTARAVNLILGILILVLLAVVIVKDDGREIYEMLIFALAAIENFIGATISFSEGKKVRGNICAVLCGVFLITVLILAMSYFVFV